MKRTMTGTRCHIAAQVRISTTPPAQLANDATINRVLSIRAPIGAASPIYAVNFTTSSTLWTQLTVIDRLSAALHEQVFVKQRGEHTTHDRRRPVEQLRLVDSARHRRTERARRIHGRARQWADRENVGGHREADRQSADFWTAE